MVDKRYDEISISLPPLKKGDPEHKESVQVTEPLKKHESPKRQDSLEDQPTRKRAHKSNTE